MIMISRQSTWDKKNILLGSFLLVALGALYYPFLQTLVADWDTNDDYSHGYFIPFLTIYFIYHISLDGEEFTDIDSAWITEAEFRYKEYKEGKRPGINAKEVFQDANLIAK